jgi:uncharacterized protein involved in outer membrane biogenesis
VEAHVSLIERTGEILAWANGKIGRVPKIAAAGVLALAALILLILSREDWNFMRGPISHFASAQTGRQVRLDGDLRAHLLSFTPEVDVGGLKIGNPTWAGPGDTAEIGLARVQARLAPLLLLRLDLPLVELRSMRLDLLRDLSQRENWALDARRTGQPLKLPPINQFLISDGHVRLVDETRKLTLTGQVEASEKPVEQGGRGFNLTGDGQLNAERFTLTAAGGPLIGVQRDKPYPFHMDLRAGPSHIALDGQIQHPFDLGALGGTVALSGPDLARLYDLTGVTLPNTPTYRLSAKFQRAGSRYMFNDISGMIGGTDLKGIVTVDRIGGRRRLDANLVSAHLNFPDLLSILGGPPTHTAPAPAPSGPAEIKLPVGKPGRGTDRRVLPDALLYSDRLRAMDADVAYRAQAIKGGAFSLQRGALKLNLDHGVLTLDPVSLDLAQGRLSGKVRIDASGAVVKTDLDMSATNIGLQQMIHQGASTPTLEGVLQGRMRLSGQGASVHQAAAAANGQVVLVIPHGRIRQAFAELMGVNVGRGLYMLLSKDPKQTDMRCAVAQFEVQNGVMTARQFVIDTGVVTATGSGDINLGTERLDLKIKGHTKHPELLRLWTPIDVSGSFYRPTLGVDAGQAAAQGGVAVGLAALLGPLSVVLPFISPGLAKDADCQSLLADAKSAAGSKPKSTTP